MVSPSNYRHAPRLPDSDEEQQPASFQPEIDSFTLGFPAGNSVVNTVMKVAVIGLGKLGLPCAEVLAQAHHVTGYDLRPVASPVVQVFPTVAEAVGDRDIILVAVQTPHDPRYGGEAPTSHLPPADFIYSHVIDALRDVDRYAPANAVVVLISTVLPGTIRREIASAIPNRRLLYNPYLIAMGTVRWDMVNPEMLIAGSENGADEDFDVLRRLYGKVMQNAPRWAVGTWEEAESIKILYNTFISTKIALVNLAQDMAERVGHMNCDVVTSALAQSSYRITGPAYMKAGLGDGGACHPRDNIAMRHMAANLGLGYDLFAAVMESRELQAKNMADTLLRHGTDVVIVGRAYKPGVAYTDGSPSMLVGHYVQEGGGTVTYYDENTGETPPLTDPAVFLIGYWDEWTTRVPVPDGSTVVDPWRRYAARDDIRVVHYGNTR